MRYDSANNSVVSIGTGCEEYTNYKQYLQWIMGHAIIEYRLRIKPVWERWNLWHKYHKKQVAILVIHYGHPGTPDYGVGYFFA